MIDSFENFPWAAKINHDGTFGDKESDRDGRVGRRGKRIERGAFSAASNVAAAAPGRVNEPAAVKPRAAERLRSSLRFIEMTSAIGLV